jgi:hypothetical protein
LGILVVTTDTIRIDARSTAGAIAIAADQSISTRVITACAISKSHPTSRTRLALAIFCKLMIAANGKARYTATTAGTVSIATNPSILAELTEAYISLASTTRLALSALSILVWAANCGGWHTPATACTISIASNSSIWADITGK